MKIHMIYLAAGNSRRFQDNKLLYNYQGQPLYRYGFNQLLKLLSNDNYTLDVVTQYPEIIFDIKQFNYPRLYVHNRRWLPEAIQTPGSFGSWCADLNLHCITAEFPPISSDEVSLTELP